MPSTSPAPGYRRLTLDLPAEDYFELKSQSLERQRQGEKSSIAILIREAVKEKLNKKKPNKK